VVGCDTLVVFDDGGVVSVCVVCVVGFAEFSVFWTCGGGCIIRVCGSSILGVWVVLLLFFGWFGWLWFWSLVVL